MEAKQKTCRQCSQQFDNTPLNFPKFESRYVLCLSCVAKKKKIAREKEELRRKERLIEQEAQAFDVMLKEAKNGGSKIPHSAELLENVLELFGGVEGFSASMMRHYYESKPGGAMRGKIIELIARLVTTNADQGGSKLPLEMWSEEELQSELDQRLKEATKRSFEIPEDIMGRASFNGSESTST